MNRRNDFPFAGTSAATMLADAITEMASAEQVSLREIGRRLGYKQPVVLSHMSSGRTPIPVDRALEIAKEVRLPAREFLLAVLQQRHPDTNWGVITTTGDHFAEELERLAGKPLSALDAKHRSVLRDVARDPDPEPRWLSISELSGVELLRELFPHVRTEGLSLDDRQMLRMLAALFNNPEPNE